MEHPSLASTSSPRIRTLPVELAKSIARFLGTYVAYSPQELLEFAAVYPIRYLTLDLVSREDQGTRYLDALQCLEEQQVCLEVILVGEVRTWGILVRRLLQSRFVKCLTWQAVNVCNDGDLALFHEFRSSKNEAHFLQLEVNGVRGALYSLEAVLEDLNCRDGALKYLDLYGSVFTEEFPCVLPFNGKQSFGVFYLRLRDVKLSHAALEAIAMELQRRNRIRQLDLSINPIGDNGVCKLARALRANNGLLRLVLVDVRMTSVGAIQLALALSQNSHLESLALFDNALGPDGARALGKMLKRNTGLKKIALKNCDFEEGCEYIADGVVSNRQLEQVSLAYNASTIREDYRRLLISHFRGCNKLWMLMLNDKFITGKVHQCAKSKRSKILKIRRANFLHAHYRHDCYETHTRGERKNSD